MWGKYIPLHARPLWLWLYLNNGRDGTVFVQLLAVVSETVRFRLAQLNSSKGGMESKKTTKASTAFHPTVCFNNSGKLLGLKFQNEKRQRIF